MKKFLQKSKEIFYQIFIPVMMCFVLFFICKGDYFRANYFLILMIGFSLLDRLNHLKDSVDTIAILLYERNKKDGIE